MDDKQKQRLNRQFAVTWFLLLLTMLAVVFMAAQRPDTRTYNYVGEKGEKGDSLIGPIGPSGETIQGPKGDKGDPGQTTIIENNTTVYKTETVKGDKGEKGEPGKDAPKVELQINPETRDLEYKTTEDSFWTTLLRCNELLIGCGEPSSGTFN